jgi:hypothetical protein
VTATASGPSTGVRDWWLRTLLVVQRPRPVFVALRDQSRDSLSDRAEPILLIVWLAGIAVVLGSAGQYLDGGGRDNLDLAIWVFLAGGIYGVFGYFALGAVLHAAVRLFGSQGTYRRTRQVLAFAAVPLVLSLVVWPAKLALYGDDVFRSGGADAGGGGHVFAVLDLLFAVWAAALLVAGVRAVHGWTWQRAGAVVAVALGAPVAVAVYLSFL